MTASRVMPRSLETVQPGGLLAALVCGAILMTLSFSVPGREASVTVGGLDAIGLLKVGSRMLLLGVLMWMLLGRLPRPASPAVLAVLVPFGVFAVWGIVSTAWSPLKAVSLGQAGSLTVQLLLASVIGLSWRNERHTEQLMLFLTIALAALAAAILAIHFYDGDLSGLNRDTSLTGQSRGVVHPTSAGATASLGLLLMLGTATIWDWKWSRWLLVPVSVVFFALLLLAASRTAVIVCLMSSLVVVLTARGRTRIVAIVGIGMLVGMYLLFDSGFGLADRAVAAARRGESLELMLSLTGRTELWSAVWTSYLESPLIGHGYFVSSKTGILDVWYSETNKTAHNVALQALVSTGVIGLGLLIWALLRVAVRTLHATTEDAEGRRVGRWLLCVAVWYAVWGQLSSSFLGPIQPESVFFYSMLGLAAAQAGRLVSFDLPPHTEARPAT